MKAFTRPQQTRQRSLVSAAAVLGGPPELLYGSATIPRPCISEDAAGDDDRLKLRQMKDGHWQMDLCLPHRQAIDLINVVGKYAGSRCWYGCSTGYDLLASWEKAIGAPYYKRDELEAGLAGNFPDGWKVSLHGDGSQMAKAAGKERPDAPFDPLWQCIYALQLYYKPEPGDQLRSLLESLLGQFSQSQFLKASELKGKSWNLGLIDAEIVLATLAAATSDEAGQALGEVSDCAHWIEMEIHRQIGSNYHNLRGWLQCCLTTAGGHVALKCTAQRLELLSHYCQPRLLYGVRPEDVADFRNRAELD